jgi:hypothetical protein
VITISGRHTVLKNEDKKTIRHPCGDLVRFLHVFHKRPTKQFLNEKQFAKWKKSVETIRLVVALNLSLAPKCKN